MGEGHPQWEGMEWNMNRTGEWEGIEMGVIKDKVTSNII